MPGDPENAGSRFVVLTQPRSGSHMLRTILSRHQNAKCLGELFNRAFPVAQLWPDCPVIDADLPAYVRGLIARAFATANGFLLHASQGLSPSWERQIYPALRTTPGVAAIRLRRRDALAQFLSLEVARKRKTWQTYSPDQIQPWPTLRVSVPDLLRFAEATQRDRLLVEIEMNGVPTIEIDYEDLDADPDAAMAPVWSHLGIPPVPAVPATLKQRTQPLDSVVLNYAECRAALESVVTARIPAPTPGPRP